MDTTAGKHARNELKMRMSVVLGMDQETTAWIAETVRRFTWADVESELDFLRQQQTPPAETAAKNAPRKQNDIAKYRRIVEWARTRYTKNGVLILSTGKALSKYSLIEDAAFNRYMRVNRDADGCLVFS